VALSLVVPVACGGSSQSGPKVPSYPAGTVADDGFRPVQYGFPFANYGNQQTDGTPAFNLTAADVEKMFGEAVCADAQSRKCDLIPEAQAWLDATNQAMGGGHCYGFSVLAALMWQNVVAPSTYGASAVPSLELYNNQALQRQIAYDWALQLLSSVQHSRVTGSPNKILLTMIDALKPRTAHAYTIVFWKRDGTGGHAVTPYAVQSKGGGKFDVLIYDNNWPGETRSISFDTNTNSWSYSASTNPDEADSLYEGDAQTKTLALDSASPGLSTQPCPFCGKVPGKGVASSAKSNTEEVSLTGSETSHPNLVISDDSGHKLGYVKGVFVDQIRGGTDNPVISGQDWTNRVEPDFTVPADKKYTLTIDGSGLSATDHENLTIIGPSYDLSVKDIAIQPGEHDTLVIEPDATHVSYTASRPELPTFQLGVSDAQAEYSFTLGGISDQPGSTLNLALPPEGGTLGLQNVGSKDQSTIDFQMTRSTEQGVQSFTHNSITLAGGDRGQFDFGSWSGSTQTIPLTVTHDGQKSTQELTNQQSP
jgi:hypothetical protein